ncbi:MAG: MFS transporter [Pseudomonadales bacterium]|jgi:MFS family permease
MDDEKISGLAPLHNRDFRLLFFGFAIGQMLMPLQFITQILWVQETAPQEYWLVLVALIGACRGIGGLIFGLYGGALADRYDRRRLLLAIQALLVLVTCAISALMYFGAGSVLGLTLFFVLTFVGAGLQSVDSPTRLAIVPDVLGPALTPAGMSLNQAAGQLSTPVAMFGAGLIIHSLGFSGAYLLSVTGHLALIVFVALMAYRRHVPAHRERRHYGFVEALVDIRFGIRYARGHPVVLWIIILLLAMMGLGFPATANLGPTWITTVVGVEIRDMGFVVMTWGIGAFLAAVLLARFPAFERRGMLIAGGALLFSASFVVFVIDNTVLNAVLGNLGLGAGMTMTMVSSTVLIQHLVPNEVRGRIMSLVQLNMGFAQLMTMPVAVLAQWLTLEVLFPVMAVTTLLVVTLILLAQPQIARARHSM